jgi:diguanylate cyclase (GGDEF)-like protein/PAS domain S-box-containing protein
MAIMQAWNAVVITSADAAAGYPVLTANPAFSRMTGYTLEELQGRSLKMLQGPDTDPQVLARMRTCLSDGHYFEGTATNYRKDGTPYVVRWNISPVRDDHGQITHFVSVQHDMTDYVLSEQRGRLLAKALDSASDPVLLTDATAHIVFANQAFANVTGYSVNELLGQTPAMLRSGEHGEDFYDVLRQELQSGRDFKAIFINRRRDGTLFHFEQNISPLRDESGRVTHYVSVGRDVTSRVKKERDLLQAATLDRLTGLFNRHQGERSLSERYAAAVASGAPLALIMCDIAHFKSINDSFGHPAGDRVIRQVTQVLRGAVRASDPVVRWGGEEFLVVLSDCTMARAKEVAELMRVRVESAEDAQVGRVTLSLGVAALQPQEPLEDFIHRCDQALYQSKRTGRNRVTSG